MSLTNKSFGTTEQPLVYSPLGSLKFVILLRPKFKFYPQNRSQRGSNSWYFTRHTNSFKWDISPYLLCDSPRIEKKGSSWAWCGYFERGPLWYFIVEKRDSTSGQGSLACCSPWGCKKSGMTELPNWTEGQKNSYLSNLFMDISQTTIILGKVLKSVIWRHKRMTNWA